MKTVLGLALTMAASLQAAQPTFKGVWHLDKWNVISASGEETEFCSGGHGILMYESSGYVSTSINCPKSTGTMEPADDYGRVFFYAGTYDERSGVIHKKVTNSSFIPLIGKSVERTIESLTEDEMVLTGPFGPKGSLWIRWLRN